MAITLNGLAVKVPAEFASTVMKQAFEQSVIGQLASSEPIPLSGKNIPIYDGGFEVGYTAEGTAKPVSDVTMSTKSIVPIKLAGITLVSSEAVKQDPAQMLEIMQADMQNAIARGIDYGILYGKSPNTGTVIPGAVYVDQTTNRVELKAGDLVPQLLAGYDLAAAGDGADPNGFAFDSRMRTKVALATQQTGATGAGAPMAMPNLATAADTVAGLKAAYGRVVAGRIGKQADTKTRGFVGDWSKLRWGYANTIELTRSDQASVVDGAGKEWHTFQDNMIAFRIEVMVGWTVTDLTAFAAYDDKVADTAAAPAVAGS